ncbi:MAG: DUF362 domain-containing protein [Thermodesulfobacteriota bacterium]
MKHKGIVFSTEYRDWHESLYPLLDRAGLTGGIASGDDKSPDFRQVLIKPNLVEALAPPVTTPVELVEALVDYIREKVPDVRIIIGEGCGSLAYDTFYCFKELGYTRLAEQKGVALLDLNVEKCVALKNSICRRWPVMMLPEIIFDSFLLSVPVLKAHSLASVTLTMKNMMGTAPPAHYQEDGAWKKASFHNRMQESILDLNCYRTPDFTVLDASIGMAESHLRGPPCSPPVNILSAGWDPVAIDAYGAKLLKKKWQNIGHIAKADGLLGKADYSLM